MVAEPERLSRMASAALVDPENDVLLSTVSAWEIAVKYDLAKLRLDRPPERYVPEERARHDVHSCPLEEEATLYLHRLPPFHRDPFDRMLVCQAIVGGMSVVTPDPNIARYPVRVLW